MSTYIKISLLIIQTEAQVQDKAKLDCSMVTNQQILAFKISNSLTNMNTAVKERHKLEDTIVIPLTKYNLPPQEIAAHPT